MRTKRLVTVGAMAFVVAAGAGTAIAVDRAPAPAQTQPGAIVGVSAPSAAVKTPSASVATRPRVVKADQPVGIGRDGARMALLVEGRQNYVVAYDDASFAESLKQAKAPGYVGDSIRRNSLSAGVATEGKDVLFTGAWRTDTTPERLTIKVGTGPERSAAMLRLPGKPGWGTYYLDAAGSGPLTKSVRITAYSAHGKVLAKLTVDPVQS
ncbi:hypothetical protein ACWEFL_14540 [Streptomyces sp. NPDC004838]